MTTEFRGPMFQRAVEQNRRSVHHKDGGHYNTFACTSEAHGMSLLREFFPEGQANDLNFALFSTSGVHGSYTTIEEVEEGLRKYPGGPPEGDDDYPDDYHGSEVTFVIVQPRLVTMTYGNAKVTLDDIPFLKQLRASSWAAAATIGRGDEEPAESPSPTSRPQEGG